MASNRSLTPLSVSVLSLLLEQPMHPYEMLQTLINRREDLIVKVRTGTLYHTVDRLAKDGLIEPVGTDRSGNRPERTSYRITEPGRQLLETEITALLSSTANEYPRFPQAIAEAHNLPKDVVIDRLRSRISDQRTRITLLRDGIRHLGEINLPAHLWLDIDYLHTIHTAELDWLVALVERLTTGDIDWDTNHRDGTPRPPEQD